LNEDSTARQHIKPILRASIDTLKQFLDDLEVNREDAESSDTQIQASGTVTHVGITGHVSGSIQYEMDCQTAKNIAGGMFQQSMKELDEDAKSALREFVNISAGNAVTEIKKQYNGQHIDITPPSLLVGEHIQLSNDVSATPVRIPLRTNYGDIVIDVALETE
jgi:CheY-specific phosphatase CheX